MAAQRTYLAIDLKSFYASVECVDRHLDPLTTNLVVADASRTEKTICLAVSPSLKAYKIPGRARLFEAVQRVREVNAQRLQTAIQQHKAVRGEDGKYRFASTSFDANALNADPALGLSYIVAPPRMQRYLDVSTQIYKTYLKYVSPADIYPYSCLLYTSCRHRDLHTAEHIVKAFYPPHAVRAFVHSKMQRDTQKHLLRCFQRHAAA